MTAVLVVNSGSSSLKYRLIETDGEAVLASGLLERIGAETGSVRHESADGRVEREVPIPDHAAAFAVMLEASGSLLDEHPPSVVGHRVVHGGERYVTPTVVTAEVEAGIEELAELAPLHNPPAVEGIRAARKVFGSIPHVAVFDTAFHRTLAPEAWTYAIDASVAAAYGVRRYGFHGTSHKFVSEAAAVAVGKPPAETKTIVLHLGNGASACAVDGGRSVATSMGLTPLEGLVMGTRPGDVDPGVLLHLARAGMPASELESMFSRRSGLLGLCGHSDMRDVLAAAADGHAASALALAVYTRRIRHYVGAYTAELGGLDVIAFTAGVGENSAPVRALSLAGLGYLGIEVDVDLNVASGRSVRRISTDDSRVAVLVVPTDEELEIARQAVAATLS